MRNPFTGEIIRAPRAPRDRKAHDQRKRDRERVRRPIIAWDGEGLAAEPGKAQPYVLLANSEGASWTDPRGLGTVRCLDALLSTAREHQGARHVAFGLSYDVNQWLREFPRTTLERLWKTGRARWRDYQVEYRPRRSFYVRRLATSQSVMVWDVQTWFGGGLAEALREWLPDFPGIDTITAMKLRRRLFAWSELDEIRAYTALELSATVELVRTLLARLTALGIRPARLDGPGGAASALLRGADVKPHMGPKRPADLERAALVAYAGGRIEPVQFGAAAGVWEYDMHAAYPWAMAQLPSLDGVTWKYEAHDDRHGDSVSSVRVRGDRRGGDAEIDPWSLYRVRWSQAREHGEGRSPWYPFPWRNRDGGIFFPSAGESWIWGCELVAYLETAGLYDCAVESVGRWIPNIGDRSVRPFAFLSDQYRARHAGDALDAALVKASVNACYGKLVQSVGWRDAPPPYYSIVWGGMVTALVRARMLRLAAQDPAAVVMFATDALFSSRRLRPADRGEEMGEWSETKHHRMIVVQSGVYLVQHAPGDGWSIYSRGYHPRALGDTPEAAASELRRLVLDGWKTGAQTVTVPQDRFVSMASWLTSPPGEWRSWVREPKQLDLWPVGKRTGGDGDPTRGLVLSSPTPIVESLSRRPKLSGAYARTWRPTAQVIADGVSPVSYEEEIEEAVL